MSPQLFEFHLPLSPEELLKNGGVNQYVVQEVLSIKQLPAQLRGKTPVTTTSKQLYVYCLSVLPHPWLQESKENILIPAFGTLRCHKETCP